MSKIELYLKAQVKLQSYVRNHADNPMLLSAEKQLEYLIDLEEGRCTDRSRLKDINIGLIAVREIEGGDDELANMLHEISSISRKMVLNEKG